MSNQKISRLGKSATDLLDEVEAMLDKAYSEAVKAWRSEDQDRIVAEHRSRIAEHIEAWANGRT